VWGHCWCDRSVPGDVGEGGRKRRGYRDVL